MEKNVQSNGANSNIERFFNVLPYGQNPFQPEMSNLYQPGYGMSNNNFGVKFGMAGPSAYGPPSAHGPSSYGGAFIGHPGNGPVVNQPRHKHKSGSSAMSAITLLAFLFFLNILQNCLKDQMNTMNPTVMVMTAGVARQKKSDADNLSGKYTSDYDPFLSSEYDEALDDLNSSNTTSRHGQHFELKSRESNNKSSGKSDNSFQQATQKTSEVI